SNVDEPAAGAGRGRRGTCVDPTRPAHARPRLPDTDRPLAARGTIRRGFLNGGIPMRTLYETLLIARRQLRKLLRNPVWVVFGLLQPILYLAFFGPLVQAIAEKAFPKGDGWSVYVPGLLVQLGLFGTSFVGFGLIAEWRMGVIERMRVTPVSRLALLMGRVLVDALPVSVQAIVLVAGCLPFRLGPFVLLLGT